MKRIKISFLTLLGCVLLGSSCISTDPTVMSTDWKDRNDAYILNMQDSVKYTQVTVPESSGGGSYFYKVIETGDSTVSSPISTDKVMVQYRGKLINGSVFDETYTSDVSPDGTTGAKTFTVNQVIAGWSANLMHMKVGEVRKIVLSQELGYGAAGAYPAIQPYSVTVWEVRLLKVN